MKRIDIYKKMLRILRGSEADVHSWSEGYVFFTPSVYHRKTIGVVIFPGLCELYCKLSGNPVSEFVSDAKKIIGDKARAGNYWFNTTDAEKAKQERMDFLNKLIK